MKFITTFALLFTSMQCYADAQSGKVIGYVPYHKGDMKNFALKLENNIVEGCNTTGRFYFDDSNPSYNEMVSSVMSAYHSKTTVAVHYAKTCNVWGNSYDVKYICIGAINC